MLVFVSLFFLIGGVGGFVFTSNTHTLCHENVFSKTLALRGVHGHRYTNIYDTNIYDTITNIYDTIIYI